MKKSIILLLSFFFASQNIQSMQTYAQQRIQQEALQAKEYNKNSKYFTFIDNLIKLPSDCLDRIMNCLYYSKLLDEIDDNPIEYNDFINKIHTMDPYDVSIKVAAIHHVLKKREFEQSIKKYMLFSKVCTHFHELLTPQTIGFLHKHHDLDEKNELWQKLMADDKYHISEKRIPALILICAGATDNTNIDDLFHIITISDKAAHAEILFQHGISPNSTDKGIPLFFNAKTPEMVKTFITYGANIHTEIDKWPLFTHHRYSWATNHPCVKNQLNNVLWYMLDNSYKPELMEFYLSQNVSPKKLYTNEPLSGAFCILHACANHPYGYIYPNIHIVKKTELLLKVMPEMVNIEDSHGQTPLDILLDSLRRTGYSIEKHDKDCSSDQYKNFAAFAKEFILLFKKYGAKTYLEIKEEKEKSDCILF